jgi:hypothetical protein
MQGASAAGPAGEIYSPKRLVLSALNVFSIVAQFKHNRSLDHTDAQMVSRVLTCLIVALLIAVFRLSGAAEAQRWDTRLLLIGGLLVMIVVAFFLS